MPRPGLRRAFLTLHLYAGLAASAILVCTALTGSVLALQPDLDAWLHPRLLRVAPAGARLPERDLLALAARSQAARGDSLGVAEVGFGGADEPQAFEMRSGARVFVNPYSGAVLGVRTGRTGLEEFLGTVHQFHVRLLAGNAGEWVVDLATLLLVVLVPTGLVLWWQKKRLAPRRGTSWRAFTWDLHSVAGFWSALFLLLLAGSGVLLAWEAPLYWLAGARPERDRPVPHSVLPPDPESPAPRGDADAWLTTADAALPGQATFALVLPATPRSAVQVGKHGPHGLGRSMVYVDRYDAHLLRADDFTRGPRTGRAHVIDRALHTGDIAGRPARYVLALASLSLAVLALTGTILWWKRVVR